ncbi:MAG TPA: hypothetical protein VLY03_13660 [Bacteroidota bacterium]|nr:hypothetical protein [Bacteroidota bacterium]
MKTRVGMIAGLSACFLLLLSCSREPEPSNPLVPMIKASKDTVRVDTTKDTIVMKRTDLSPVLKSQMVAASCYRSVSGSTADRVAPLLLALGGDELDLSVFQNFSFSFNHGVYEAAYGEQRIRAVFYFAEQFGSFRSGDTIPYHLFAIDSYVRNITLTWTGVHYDHGPLFNLITGTLRFNGLNPVITIGAEKLLFSMECHAFERIHEPGSIPDTLNLSIHTRKANVQDFADQLATSGVMFDIDSTSYASPFYGSNARIDSSLVTVRKQDEKYSVDGELSGRMQHNGTVYYFDGRYSSNGETTFDFYLDHPVPVFVGTSYEVGDLQSGIFRYASGDTLQFQLP